MYIYIYVWGSRSPKSHEALCQGRAPDRINNNQSHNKNISRNFQILYKLYKDSTKHRIWDHYLRGVHFTEAHFS